MEEIGQLVEASESFVRNYGAFAVMPILAIEAIGAPVPGELLLIFASVLAGRGEMSLPSLLIFAWVGSVVGDNLGYLIGRKFGRGTILRYGAKVGLTNKRFNGIERVYIRDRSRQFCSPASLASCANSTVSWREWPGGVSFCSMQSVQRFG